MNIWLGTRGKPCSFFGVSRLIGTDRNGPKRTLVDTETDSLGTETDSLGTEKDGNGPKRTFVDTETRLLPNRQYLSKY